MLSIFKNRSVIMFVAGFFSALLLSGLVSLTQAIEMIPRSCCKTPLTVISACGGARSDMTIVRYQTPSCLTRAGLKIHTISKLSHNTFQIDYLP